MSSAKKATFKPITGVCIAVAVVCVVIAMVYFTRSADALPSFFPGHQAGVTRHHTKHGIAFLGLAVLALVGAWMTSAPKDTAPKDAAPTDTAATSDGQ
jgi:amino acid permease